MTTREFLDLLQDVAEANWLHSADQFGDIRVMTPDGDKAVTGATLDGNGHLYVTLES